MSESEDSNISDGGDFMDIESKCAENKKGGEEEDESDESLGSLKEFIVDEEEEEEEGEEEDDEDEESYRASMDVDDDDDDDEEDSSEDSEMERLRLKIAKKKAEKQKKKKAEAERKKREARKMKKKRKLEELRKQMEALGESSASSGEQKARPKKKAKRSPKKEKKKKEKKKKAKKAKKEKKKKSPKKRKRVPTPVVEEESEGMDVDEEEEEEEEEKKKVSASASESSPKKKKRKTATRTTGECKQFPAVRAKLTKLITSDHITATSELMKYYNTDVESELVCTKLIWPGLMPYHEEFGDGKGVNTKKWKPDLRHYAVLEVDPAAPEPVWTRFANKPYKHHRVSKTTGNRYLTVFLSADYKIIIANEKQSRGMAPARYVPTAEEAEVCGLPTKKNGTPAAIQYAYKPYINLENRCEILETFEGERIHYVGPQIPACVHREKMSAELKAAKEVSQPPPSMEMETEKVDTQPDTEQMSETLIENGVAQVMDVPPKTSREFFGRWATTAMWKKVITEEEHAELMGTEFDDYDDVRRRIEDEGINAKEFLRIVRDMVAEQSAPIPEEEEEEEEEKGKVEEERVEEIDFECSDDDFGLRSMEEEEEERKKREEEEERKKREEEEEERKKKEEEEAKKKKTGGRRAPQLSGRQKTLKYKEQVSNVVDTYIKENGDPRLLPQDTGGVLDSVDEKIEKVSGGRMTVDDDVIYNGTLRLVVKCAKVRDSTGHGGLFFIEVLKGMVDTLKISFKEAMSLFEEIVLTKDKEKIAKNSLIHAYGEDLGPKIRTAITEMFLFSEFYTAFACRTSDSRENTFNTFATLLEGEGLTLAECRKKLECQRLELSRVITTTVNDSNGRSGNHVNA